MKKAILFLAFALVSSMAIAQVPATDPVVKSITWEEQDNPPSNPSVNQEYHDTDGKTYVFNGSIWVEETAGAVDSVNGNIGVVVLDADDLAEGTTNKFMTAAERANVVANTTKVSYPGDQNANGVFYDNTTSGRAASTVQGVIDEISADVTTVNLDYTASATNGVVTNSAGDNSIIPLGDNTDAGLIKPAHYSKVEKAIVSDTTGLDALGGKRILNIVAMPKDSIAQVVSPPTTTLYVPNDGIDEKSFVIKWGAPGDDIVIDTDAEHVPIYDAITITRVEAYLDTAPTGSVATFDINEDGVSILSTKLTIDATEKWSDDAATQAVISDSAIDAKSKLSVACDGVGSTVAGADPTITIYYTINGIWLFLFIRIKRREYLNAA